MGRWHLPYGKKQRTKEPVDESEKESDKVGLKFNIQESKIKASGPITSWPIDGETMETMRLYFGGSKITADGDYNHEMKRQLLFGRKAMTDLDSILKSRDITLPTKVHLVKANGFSNSHVWMWELDYKIKLSIKGLMLLNCGVGEDSWESLGLQGDPTHPF